VTSAYGSGFHPPLKVPSRAVRIVFQAVVLLLIGTFVLRSHGLTFDLTPWTQVIINGLVGIFYSREGQEDTTVLLFQESNLLDFGDTYPVPYARHAQVLETLADFEPRSVFIDFVFMDDRPGERASEKRLLEAMHMLSRKLPGGLYLAAPFGDDALDRAEAKFGPSGVTLVSAEIDQDTGVSGVLTYSNGTNGSGERSGRGDIGRFLASPAFAMAEHRTKVLPAAAKRMEIIWPSGTSASNEKWMKPCTRQSEPGWWAAMKAGLARLMHDPLEEKEMCPYTTTVSVAHLLGSFDPLVDKAIRGRAVFYGAAFEGAGDRARSPVYRDLPGVYLHAMAYDNLVSFGPRYKKADRGRLWPLAVSLPLLVVAGIWIVECTVGKVGRKEKPEKPREWLPRALAHVGMEMMVLLIAGIAIVLGFRAGLLFTVPGYLLYRVIMYRDWLGLLAAGLLVVVAGISFSCLDVGPRNLVGYLALLEVARRLRDGLDEGTGKYLQLRGARAYDHEWGKWARHRQCLDRVIGLWVRGRLGGR
jgi:CHASE2 domain-containing sensor protein